MNELGERCDLKDERDSELYQAMLETVEAEMLATAADCGFPNAKPHWRVVHDEAIRRLRACTK